jgi:hypothetical protein
MVHDAVKGENYTSLKEYVSALTTKIETLKKLTIVANVLPQEAHCY